MRSLFATIRQSVLAAVLVGGTIVRPAPFSPAPKLPEPSVLARTSYFISEVRLRKLHLVRPDLIPYPINFEVYC